MGRKAVPHAREGQSKLAKRRILEKAPEQTISPSWLLVGDPASRTVRETASGHPALPSTVR